MDTRTKQSFGWLPEQMPKVSQLISRAGLQISAIKLQCN